jgi:hypothetical protein
MWRLSGLNPRVLRKNEILTARLPQTCWLSGFSGSIRCVRGKTWKNGKGLGPGGEWGKWYRWVCRSHACGFSGFWRMGEKVWRKINETEN